MVESSVVKSGKDGFACQHLVSHSFTAGVMVYSISHACNLRTREAEAGEVSLG